MTFTGLAGGAVFNGQAVSNSYYGTACTYLSYNGQGIHDGNNFQEHQGQWQCVPCDGPTWACCQVVCAPAGYGYDWGHGAPAPRRHRLPALQRLRYREHQRAALLPEARTGPRRRTTTTPSTAHRSGGQS